MTTMQMPLTGTMDVAAMVRQAKTNQLARDYARFASGVLNAIILHSTKEPVRMYISRHFPERMIQRDMAEREDRLFVFKLLSYVCEHRYQPLLEDQDVFVRYKDLVLMMVCHRKDGAKQVRLNTAFENTEEAFFNEKNSRKYKIIDVDIKELMNYVPLTLQDGYVKEERVERRVGQRVWKQ